MDSLIEHSSNFLNLLDQLLNLLEQYEQLHDATAIEEIVNKYITKIANNQEEISIPLGLTWFGVNRSLSDADLEGRIVILDFFTYCCMNCIHVIAQLKEFEEKFSNAPVLVLGVHSPKFDNEKQEANLKNALEKMGISHPVVNDPDTILWDKLGISCWPTLLVLGPTRKPLLILPGEGHVEKLAIFVKAALKYYGNKPSTTQLPLSSSTEAVPDRLISYPNQVTVSIDGLIGVTSQSKVIILSKDGTIQHIIGGNEGCLTDGPFGIARFNNPQGIIFHGKSNLIVADSGNHAIRQIDINKKLVSTIIGNGKQGTDLKGGKNGVEQVICSPWGLCVCQVPQFLPAVPQISRTPLLIPSETGGPNLVFSVPSVSNIQCPSAATSTLSLQYSPSAPPPPPVHPVTPHFSEMSTVMMPQAGNPAAAPVPPLAPAPPPCPGFVSPSVNSESTKKEVLFISMSGSHQLWAYFFEDMIWWKGKEYKQGTCHAIAGTGREENRNNRYPMSASFAQPSGICYCPELNCVCVADSESSSVRKLCLATGQVSPVVGGQISPDDLFSYGDVDGIGPEAKLQHPLGVSWDSTRQQLYVVDTYNHKLKSVDIRNRLCSHIKLPVTLNEPGGVFVDGSLVYIADTNNHCLLFWNVDDLSLTKFNIRQRIETLPNKSESRQLWRAEANVLSDGSEVKLLVKLPTGVSGRWRFCSGPDGSVKNKNGVVIDGCIEIDLFFNSSSEIDFNVDLAECRDNACFMSYYRLLMTVIVSEEAKKFCTLCITPELAS